MSLSLIIDRASSDNAALNTLRSKIRNRTATSAEWAQWLNDSKGAYNDSDLNRVGEAIAYIAGLLNGYGYAVAVSPKTNWTQQDIPREADMTLYIADLNTLKSAFYGATELPGAMDNLGYENANNIEKLLLEIEEYINRMARTIDLGWALGLAHTGLFGGVT